MLDNGGEIVVKLPEQWRLATDEDGTGVEQGWHRADFDDADWRTAGTFTQTWTNLDLGMQGFYHGDVWYRTTFDLPADARDKDLRLWFGGFDHNVDVYINGQSIGELTGFVKPQELNEIESALHFGEENVIAVRCNSGGIMFPVMIYAAPENSAGEGEDGESEGDGETYQM